jgi:malonate transporter
MKFTDGLELGEIKTGRTWGRGLRKAGRGWIIAANHSQGSWRRAERFSGAETIAPVLAILLVTFPFFRACAVPATSRRASACCRWRPYRGSTALCCSSRCLACCTALVPPRRSRSCWTCGACRVPAVRCALVIVAIHRDDQPERAHPLERCAFRRAGGGVSQHRLHGRAAAGGAAGRAAAGPAIVTIVVDMVITTSLCIALSRLDDVPMSTACRQAAAKTRSRACAVWRQPHALGHPGRRAGLVAAVEPARQAGDARPPGLLADAASPVALFTIGAVLARSQIVAALHATPCR